LFSDALSKQAAATKIQILAASPVLHVLVVDNKAASLHHRENATRLARFSRFLTFLHRNAAKKRIQTPQWLG
jgi:hypothetical protein